ncbi:exodeoxyribonuclease III [Candidatus Peregrinibacteria bacterium]|nr:MAG: exodeoxyribonuclease III [Candidatus Peregrinibacteria bacterium]
MIIISWNVNGIRSVERKGELLPFLVKYRPDILLMQETKATPEKLSAELREHPEYHQFYHSAEKPGYAGTGIWVKKSFCKNPSFSSGMPLFSDTEGRIARVDIDSKKTVLGIYFPNGGKSEQAWEEKIVFYNLFLEYMNALREEGREVIWAGDVNCAHEEIDIARPKENKNSIGFLPEERTWVTRVIENNWKDVFREKYPNVAQYSWWHLLSGARARNVGWRIDYVFADKALFSKIQRIEYLSEQMGSDHCPVRLEIDW